jgi:nitrile hydratase accessory protein
VNANTTQLTLEDIARQCAGGMPLPSVSDGTSDSPGAVVFAEPWQAHAFAMTVQLHEKGLFTWPQWAAALTQAIHDAQARGDADDGRHYYLHWLNALEHMVIQHKLGTPDQIHDLEHAWEDAAARTPHGQAIVLDAVP